MGMLLLFLCGLTLFVLFVFEIPIPGFASTHQDKTTEADAPLGVELVKNKPNTLIVPEDVRRSLGIREGKQDRIATAEIPTRTRSLVLPGSTALDPTRIMRIRARFAPARVTRITTVVDPNLTAKRKGETQYRELRAGDKVKAGQTLAVFYSVDVGQKKNDLFDALVQLKLDQTILDRAEKGFLTGAVPEVFLLTARRNVQGDRNAINRAENTLRAWDVPEEDIKVVHKEAEQAAKIRVKGDKSSDKSDPQQVSKEQLDRWARVELKSPTTGIIVERNVSMQEMVVDNTVALFQIARVDQLMVLANAPEDDLPVLHKLLKEERLRWTIKTLAGESGPEEAVDDISYQIDVNQHSVVVKGHIDNPGGRLRGGQFITATINLPPPDDVVEIPTTAVVDDGRQCLVFVQTNARKHQYTLRRVVVTHRFDKTVFVRSDRRTALEKQWDALLTSLFGEGDNRTQEEIDLGLLPREPLRVGERVLTTGALELKKELEDQQSKLRD
jgi:cobalt-zinc-cadmium efflux system membrane fusion protein